MAPKKPMIPPPGQAIRKGPSRGRYQQQGDPGTPNIQQLERPKSGEGNIKPLAQQGRDLQFPDGDQQPTADHGANVAGAIKAAQKAPGHPVTGVSL